MGYEIAINERVRAYLAAAEPGLERRLREALLDIGTAAEQLRRTNAMYDASKLYLFLGRHRFDYQVDADHQRVTVLSGFAAT